MLSINPSKIKSQLIADVKNFYESGSSNLYKKLNTLGTNISKFEYNTSSNILTIECSNFDGLSDSVLGSIEAAINKDIKDLTDDKFYEIHGRIQIDDYEVTNSKVILSYDVNLTKCICELRL